MTKQDTTTNAKLEALFPVGCDVEDVTCFVSTNSGTVIGHTASMVVFRDVDGYTSASFAANCRRI